MFDVITIGDVVVDTHLQIDDASVECGAEKDECKLCFDYATKVPIKDSFQSLGGNAANVSVGLSTLGLKTSILTSLGDDSNGDLSLKELEKNNVDTSLVTKEKDNITRYAIILNFQGERTILSHHRKRKYTWPDKMPATNWVYYTGLSEGFEDIQKELFDYTKKHGSLRIVFNPGSYQIKKAMDLVIEAVKKSDILIVNLQEAEKILGTTLEKEKSETSLIHGLLNLGVKEVVITDADRGAWAGDIDSVYHIDSFPIEVVAKTGAGDAFSSGYLSARVKGEKMEQALLWGIANSCSTITEPGAQKGLLTEKGVKQKIAKYNDIKPRLIEQD